MTESVATGDVAALRAGLAAAERRAATLAELTALMSEGRDPLALAQRAVELTARATKAAGAFVYLWDRDEERLVLRVSTEGHQRGHLGQIKLRIGEGITGWVALMRQTVVVPTAPQLDPRFKPFPELRESLFKSMMAVPIVAPGEEVLGVFTLYALTENGFAANDVNLASEVGALLASGLVQAETLSRLRVQSAAAQFLRDLPDETWGSLEGCLHAMARQCAADIDVEVCVIEMATEHGQPGGLTVIELAQRFRDQHADVLSGDPPDKATLGQLLAPLGLHRLRIPLGSATPIGALTCYRTRRFTPEVEVLVESIAAQMSAGALSLYGTQRARPIVDQLLSAQDIGTTERLLKRYGWPDRPSWATLIRPHWSIAADPLAEDDALIRDLLHDVFGADDKTFLLLGGGRRFLALAEATDDAARDRLFGRIGEMKSSPTMRLVAGLGPIATDAQEMHRGIRHAAFASHWAELVGPTEGAAVRYEDVAHLRLLPRTVLEMGPDLKSLLGSLGGVVRYDLENGTDLAQTLDSFLTSSGSVAKSSTELFIHRNTLRQRIQRIEELIGRSPEAFDDWITAGVAVRLIRASEAELSRQPGPRTPAKCPLGVVTVGRSCCGMPNHCVHL